MRSTRSAAARWSAPSSFKTSDYLGMIETLAPELATAEPGKLKAQRLPTLEFVIRMGDDNSPGMFNFADVMARGGPRRARAPRPDLRSR